VSETTIMRKCLLTLTKFGRYFRNNSGVLQDKNGTYVHYGLCTGSSDIIGCTPIVVTNKMVGKTVGVFTAIEVKSDKGKPTKEQSSFIEMVKNNGGISGIARSDKESLQIIQNYVESMKD